MQPMMRPRTLFDKQWDAHAILKQEHGDTLLWIDRHFVHEGSHHAFAKLAARALGLARPDLTFGVADHYVPTTLAGAGLHPSGEPAATRAVADPVARGMVEKLSANARRHGVTLFGLDDPRQGIVHVVGPEQGLTLPGTTIVCGDSHTATHGALGAYAFGIGASEVAHVLATQTLWQRKPRRMRISVDGRLAPGLGAKDMILSIIARIGTDGAVGHAVEYAGSAVRGLSIEGRLTLCNMSIEAGARTGMVAPDATTIAYLRGRPFVPKGAAFDAAAEQWLALTGDDGAEFDREITLDAGAIAPTLTWGTSPEHALPITAAVPDPGRIADPAKAAHVRDAIDYMGLVAGQALDGIAVDRVFIGSCTNSRIEDLRVAARIAAGKTVNPRVNALVVPGSGLVKEQAEAEGLDKIFIAAGFEWREPGCSMCLAMNPDKLEPGQRCASTSNRNFEGRQGSRGRTHLVSPAMAAAAAIAGHFVDVRGWK